MTKKIIKIGKEKCIHPFICSASIKAGGILRSTIKGEVLKGNHGKDPAKGTQDFKQYRGKAD